MSINETPYTFNHKIVVPLPLSKIDGASSTTDNIFMDPFHQNGITNGSNGMHKQSISTTAGEPICNFMDAADSTKHWTMLNVLNPFDPITFQPVNTKLNAESLLVINRYRRFRVLSCKVDFHFLNTPDQGHDSGTRFHLPLIFGVNKIYNSQHRSNHPIQCWNKMTDSAADFTGKGFNIDDYYTYEAKNGTDVCVGGGWRLLSGGDAPLTIKWDRMTHYYDKSKFDSEWAEILYNNTNLITHAPGGKLWNDNSGDDTSDAKIAQVPYYAYGFDNTQQSMTAVGEQPIFLEPYGLCPGHDYAGQTDHPSIKALYRAVVTYNVEFSEPHTAERWMSKANLTMSRMNGLITSENPNNGVFDQPDNTDEAQIADKMRDGNAGVQEMVTEVNDVST